MTRFVCLCTVIAGALLGPGASVQEADACGIKAPPVRQRHRPMAFKSSRKTLARQPIRVKPTRVPRPDHYRAPAHPAPIDARERAPALAVEVMRPPEPIDETPLEVARPVATPSAERPTADKPRSDKPRSNKPRSDKPRSAKVARRVEAAPAQSALEVSVYFDVGSARLDASAAELGEVAEWLRANPNGGLSLEGHTDSRGSTAANMRLSQRRAAAVEAYLTAEIPGADARIDVDGRGEEGAGASAAQSRRVVIRSR